MDNPFDGIVPDFTIFGAEFTTLWQKLFAGFLAILLIITGGMFAKALATMHRANSSNMPGQVDEAKGKAVWAGGAFGAVICFVPITIAIFSAVG